MEDVAGPHFTFVDPRNHDDAREMERQALRLMRLFAKKGYQRNRIVISVSSSLPGYVADQTGPDKCIQIPATEAGVQAAMMLGQKHSVRTNLLFVSGLGHAAICAGAGASFVMFSYAAVSHSILFTDNKESTCTDSFQPRSYMGFPRGTRAARLPG